MRTCADLRDSYRLTRNRYHERGIVAGYVDEALAAAAQEPVELVSKERFRTDLHRLLQERTQVK
jgi:hypothetical protein